MVVCERVGLLFARTISGVEVGKNEVVLPVLLDKSFMALGWVSEEEDEESSDEGERKEKKEQVKKEEEKKEETSEEKTSEEKTSDEKSDKEKKNNTKKNEKYIYKKEKDLHTKLSSFRSYRNAFIESTVRFHLHNSCQTTIQKTDTTIKELIKFCKNGNDTDVQYKEYGIQLKSTMEEEREDLCEILSTKLQIAKKAANVVEKVVQSSGMTDCSTFLRIINMLSFKCSWRHPFYIDTSQHHLFKVDQKRSVKVSSMRVTQKLRITEQGGVRMIELPLLEPDLVAFLVSTLETHTQSEDKSTLKSLSDFLTRFDEFTVTDWVGTLTEQYVNLVMPILRELTVVSHHSAQPIYRSVSEGGSTGDEVKVERVSQVFVMDINEKGIDTKRAESCAHKHWSHNPTIHQDCVQIKCHVDGPFLLIVYHTRYRCPVLGVVVSDPICENI